MFPETSRFWLRRRATGLKTGLPVLISIQVLLGFWLFLCCLLLAGCSSKQQECSGVECVKDEAREIAAEECRNALFRHSTQSRAVKKAINEKYRYPYTNVETYGSLTSMGAKIPSPRAWCRGYASAVVR